MDVQFIPFEPATINVVDQGLKYRVSVEPAAFRDRDFDYVIVRALVTRRDGRTFFADRAESN